MRLSKYHKQLINGESEFCYHKTDTAAFFKVIAISITKNQVTILKIDNLRTMDNRDKLIYTVPLRELKEDYRLNP